MEPEHTEASDTTAAALLEQLKADGCQCERCQAYMVALIKKAKTIDEGWL